MSSILIGYVRGNALPAYQPENSLWRPAWMIMHAASYPPMGSKAAAHTASWMPTATLPQRSPLMPGRLPRAQRQKSAFDLEFSVDMAVRVVRDERREIVQ